MKINAFEQYISTFSEDGGLTYRENYTPSRFIKNPEEIEICTKLLQENFEII